MNHRFINPLINGKHVILLTCFFSLIILGAGLYFNPLEISDIPFSGSNPKLYTPISRAINWGMLILVSFILHLLNKEYRICREQTKLFFIFPVIFVSSSFLVSMSIKESLVALFFVSSYFPFFNAYQQYNSTRNVFNSSLLLSFITLLEPTFWIFIPVFYLGLFQFRALHLKSFLASLFALIIPYWLIGGFLIYLGNIEYFLQFKTIFVFSLKDLNVLSIREITVFGITFIAVLTSVFHSQADNRGDKVKTRLFLQYSILMLIAFLFIRLFVQSDNYIYTYLFYLAATPLLARYFTLSRTYFSIVLFYILIFIYLISFVIQIYG